MANPYNLGFGFYGGHDCDTVMKPVSYTHLVGGLFAGEYLLSLRL